MGLAEVSRIRELDAQGIFGLEKGGGRLRGAYPPNWDFVHAKEPWPRQTAKRSAQHVMRDDYIGFGQGFREGSSVFQGRQDERLELVCFKGGQSHLDRS